jgi:hypothetical protein
MISASGGYDQSLLDHFRRRNSSRATSVQLELGNTRHATGRTGTLVEAGVPVLNTLVNGSKGSAYLDVDETSSSESTSEDGIQGTRLQGMD